MIATSSYEDKDEMLYILHALGASRCKKFRDCDKGCDLHGIFNGKVPDTQFNPRCRKDLDEFLENFMIKATTSNFQDGSSRLGGRILCLDGGGIKGLVLTQLLLAIQEASGDRPILDLFDWIAGTSTGGILALALASGKSVPDARRLYFRFKNTIFYGSRPYAEEPLEELLKKEFGEDKFMSDIKGVKLIVTGVLVDRSQAELHLFRNYDSPQYLMKGNCHPGNPAASCEFYTPAPPQEQLVWKTARATGAAPSYFPSSGAYLDGGIIANNPTLDVLTEITEYNTILKSLNRASEIIKPQVVFSLGTGCYSLEKNDVIDSVSPTIMTWDFGNYSKLQELFDLLLNQATRTVDRARSWCSMCDISYIRLNPELNENIELNETDDAKLVNMLWETMIYIKGKREQIQTFANLLTTGLPNNDL